MSKYYEAKIDQIKSWLKKGDFKQAEHELMVELKMPYIPPKFEKKFQLLNQELQLLQNPRPKAQHLSESEIVNFLWSNDPLKEAYLISFLQTYNLHPLSYELKKFLETAPAQKQIFKTSLFELLIAQKVDLAINFNGQLINPSQTLSILEHKAALEALTLIEQKTFKDVQIRDIALAQLDYFLLKKFPQQLPPGQILAQEIIAIAHHILDNSYSLSVNQQRLFDFIQK